MRFLDLPERFNDENNNDTKNVCKSVNTNKNNYSEGKDFIHGNDFTNNSNVRNVNNYCDKGDIVLENVTFSYPLSSKNAIERINLEILQIELLLWIKEQSKRWGLMMNF